jgi:PAS domain S-box-containing protein
LLHDEDVEAYVVNYRDVTVSKEAEKELINKEKHYRALIENISDAIVLVDEFGQVKYHSPSAQNVTPWQQSVTDGKTVFDYFHPDDVTRARDFFTRALQQPEKPISTMFRIKQEDGSVTWVEGSMTNLLHDEAVKALVINYRDITHRKEAEELIHKSEAKVRTILDNASIAYILTDPTLRVVSFNLCASEQYYKEIGVTLREGDLLTSYIVPGFQDALEEYFDRVFHGEKVWFEYSNPGNSDASWYNVTISPVYDKQKNILGVMLASEDISLRKQRELERGRLTRDIIRHNRDLEQFAYIVSHNLRSPVANILGLSNILQEREKLSNADFEKCLKGITLSVSKLDDVIRDLNLILQSRQAVNEKRETIYFGELLDSIRTSISDLIEKDNVKIISEFNVESILSIKGFLHSILFNLVSNSIKYRHPERQLRIEISTDLVDEKLLLKVRDNGLGFDLKLNREKVFGLYKKFHSHIEGKGMGLYMVKTQVESLGGRISVNSEVNKGTEFLIRFDF